MTATTRYTFGTTVADPIDKVRPRVEAALRTEGFGVLTEIDVAATLKAKLGVERPPYLILGACNPTLAHAALEADPSIGALLPCNVVLREDEPGITAIEVLDPVVALSIAGEPSIAPIASEARERLSRVVAAIEAPGT
ncbi:MAG: DUF302 domain-containing protein [Candidatus Limnocylindrales bacterium]|nr:DUF302 domain-containing protein [Candidatus Limnocylindrales bacterium]